MAFIFGNLATLAIHAFADLDSASQLALSALVIILNVASVLSFDTELKQFAAINQDTNDANSNFAKAGNAIPYGAFRIFCLLICLVAAVTQVMAINA